MSMNDLTSLFQKGTEELGFRQGTVVMWDETTGRNQIAVGGTILTDLPALLIGDFAILQTNDVVGLLRYRSTYFILGRIVPPQGPDLNRATIDFGAHGASAVAFSIQPGAGTPESPGTLLAPGDIPVPTWADQAIVHATVNASIQNTDTTATNQVYLQAWISGAPGGAASAIIPPGSYATFAASAIRTMTRDDWLGDTINVAVGLAANGATALAASAYNLANIDVTAIFRRVN